MQKYAKFKKITTRRPRGGTGYPARPASGMLTRRGWPAKELPPPAPPPKQERPVRKSRSGTGAEPPRA